MRSDGWPPREATRDRHINLTQHTRNVDFVVFPTFLETPHPRHTTSSISSGAAQVGSSYLSLYWDEICQPLRQWIHEVRMFQYTVRRSDEGCSHAAPCGIVQNRS